MARRGGGHLAIATTGFRHFTRKPAYNSYTHRKGKFWDGDELKGKDIRSGNDDDDEGR